MKRTPYKTRVAQLLTIVIDAALDCPIYTDLTRAEIARYAGCAPSLINYYLGSRDELIDALMRAALNRNVTALIAQGAALRHPVITAAPEAVQRRAIKAYYGRNEMNKRNETRLGTLRKRKG